MSGLFLLSKTQMLQIEGFFLLLRGILRVDDRRVVGEIVSALKNGLRWCDAPAAYGPHKTIPNRFIRWSRLGVFNYIFAGLAGAGLDVAFLSDITASIDYDGLFSGDGNQHAVIAGVSVEW